MPRTLYESDGVSTSTYDDLADEYYDREIHPTCDNFRQISKKLIFSALQECGHLEGAILEIGAGRSVVCELHDDFGIPRHLSSVVLSDGSRGMLSYSTQWNNSVSGMVVCDARSLPFIDSGIALIVCSLGDPYNDIGFWREAYRVLSPKGKIVFTAPSYEWAMRYRSTEPLGGPHLAVFSTRAGARSVPSYVLNDGSQCMLCKSSGFIDVSCKPGFLSELPELGRSNKLKCIESGDAPAVSCYIAEK